MNIHHKREEVRALRSTRERVAQLLSRYPRIARHEIDEILTFLRTGRHLEIGLLTSNEGIRPQLDAFMQDHKNEFQLGWAEATVVVSAILAFLAILWFVWEAAS